MHHFSRQILALDLLLLLSGQQFDRIRIRKVGLGLLGRNLLEIGLISLDLVVDDDGRKSRLHVLLELGVGVSALQSQWVSSYHQQVDMLHLRHEPESLLVSHQVVTEVQLLQLSKISLLVQHFRVQGTKLVSGQVESLELGNLTNCLEKESWVDQVGGRAKLIGSQVEVLEPFKLRYVLW